MHEKVAHKTLPMMQHKGRLTKARTSASRVSDNLVEIITTHSPSRFLVVLLDFLLDQVWVLLVVRFLETVMGEDPVAMLACSKK